MNPLTNVKNITKLNETELASGSIHKKSWHDMYKESAWVFIGGLPYDLTEGDILAVFSQYGEIVNINLVRDKKSGKSKGFCFLCYSNQKSTILAVDNFNGIKLCNRTIRVDHVANYKPPKEDERDDEITKKLKSEGCAPKIGEISTPDILPPSVKKKKPKKEKKEKKKKKKKSNRSDSEKETVEVKKERYDPGYDKYDILSNNRHDGAKSSYEKSLDTSKGESSRTQEKYRSKTDRENDRTEISSTNHSRLLKNIKQEKELCEDRIKYTISLKVHREKRAQSSSDEQSSNLHNKRHRGVEDNLGNKYSGSKHKYSGDYSSSSDSDSSTNSSDEEKDRPKSKYSKEKNYELLKIKYDARMSDVNRSYSEEGRQKSYQPSKDSVSSSSKNRHCKTMEKYSEHKSKNRHKSDDYDDADQRNSYQHKRTYDRR